MKDQETKLTLTTHSRAVLVAHLFANDAIGLEYDGAFLYRYEVEE